MDSQSFAALTQARLNGEIPKSVYFWNLQHGEYIQPGMDLDAFLEELDQEGINHGPDGDNPGAGSVPPAKNVIAPALPDPKAKQGEKIKA